MNPLLLLLLPGLVSAIGEGWLDMWTASRDSRGESTTARPICQDLDQITKAMLGLGSMFAANVKTVPVETDLLMGKWHQMYKAAMNFDVFRTSMYCEVAYFRPNAVLRVQGGFEMLEAYRVTDKNGPVETYKRDVPQASPGRFWMHTQEYFYPREFNIVKLGKRFNETEGENGTVIGYDYLIVTDSRRTSLMVFARDPEEFRQKYIKEVFEYFKDECFGNGCFWNQAEKIYQEQDCQWPSEKEVLVRRALKAHQRQATVPRQSFLESVSRGDSRKPTVKVPNQGLFSGVDPLSALQGLFQNLPAISSAVGGKK